MKRILLVLFFISCLAIQPSAEILSTLTIVTQEARQTLGIDTTDNVYLSYANGGQWTRQGISLVNRMVGDNRTNTSVVTVRNTHKYALPALYTAVTAVQWISDDTIKSLTFVPRGQWYQQPHQTTKAQKGSLAISSYYDFYDDTLYLGPVPTKIDTLVVVTVDMVNAGLDTVTVTTSIDEDYRIIILNYVVYRAATANQHPLAEQYWRDYLDARNIFFPKAVTSAQ